MQSEKTAKIIEAVRNMTDDEADILEIFISGLRAGRQLSGREPAPAAVPESGAGDRLIILPE